MGKKHATSPSHDSIKDGSLGKELLSCGLTRDVQGPLEAFAVGYGRFGMTQAMQKFWLVMW
jgi:hypothetical protein